MESIFTSSARYNQLPPVGEADELLRGCDALDKLRFLLDDYPNFAVTLVHRHSKLEPGYVMLSRDLVTQPEKPETDPLNAFPSAWLASGEPFEYSVDPNTPKLPIKLQESFQTAVTKLKVPEFEKTGIPILGICCVTTKLAPGTVYVERTDGKKNVIEIKSLTDMPERGWGITTTWLCGGPRCNCEPGTTHLKFCDFSDSSCPSKLTSS